MPTTPEEIQITMEIMSGYGYSVYEHYSPEAVALEYPPASKFTGTTLATYHNSNIDPAKHFAELELSHKPRICFYLYHLQIGYNGTNEYGLALLSSFARLFGTEIDIYVLIPEHVYQFFLPSIPTNNVHVVFMPGKLPICDVVFMTAQFFTSTHLPILYQIAPRQVVTFLDAISWRCHYLNNDTQFVPINGLGITLADGIISLSKYALSDILSYFSHIDTSTILKTHTYLANDFILKASTKTSQENQSYPFLSKPFILIFGNSYRHKSTPETVAALREVREITKVVVGGRESDYSDISPQDNYAFLKSGGIPEETMQELYSKAHLLVFPSQYEGFGLPILKALENRKKIVVFDNPLNHEIANTFVTNQGQLFFFQKFSTLSHIIRQHLGEYSLAATDLPTWDSVATETHTFIKQVLSRPIDENKLRIRWYIAKTWGSENGLLANNSTDLVPTYVDISLELILRIIYRYIGSKSQSILPRVFRKK